MSKYRIKFSKLGLASYISHLDLMRTMQRVFIRAGLKVKHSEGFNPHPKMVFAMPLSVGAESVCELLDFELETDVDPKLIPDMLNKTMPDGITVTEAWMPETKFKEFSWLKISGRFEYDSGNASDMIAPLKAFFNQASIVIERKTKKGMGFADIKPLIREINFSMADENTVLLEALIAAGEKVLNPEHLVSALSQLAENIKPDFAKFMRTSLFKEAADGSIIEFR